MNKMLFAILLLLPLSASGGVGWQGDLLQMVGVGFRCPSPFRPVVKVLVLTPT